MQMRCGHHILRDSRQHWKECNDEKRLLIPSMKGMSYVQRLQVLNLPSLKYRRYRGDLIQTFKILNKVDELNIEDFYSFSASSTKTHK